jgi:hypothetical protein
VTRSRAAVKNKKTSHGVLQSLTYMCASAKIIIEALQNGHDVTQLPNGDIIITEVKVVNTHYKWNDDRNLLTNQDFLTSDLDSSKV